MKKICLVSRLQRHRRSSRRINYLPSAWVFLLVSFLLCAANAFGQTSVRTPQQRSADRPPAGNSTAPSGSRDFDQLAAGASAARAADKIEEAIELYRKALVLRSQWAEGWWYLATLYYDQDKYADAAQAFKQTAQLQQKAGAPWAMLGLCEFQLARYDDAQTHIEQGRQLGLGDNVELTRVMRYHQALIAILKGEFEKGLETLGSLSYEGLKSEDLIISLGLATLRIGMMPARIDLNYPDRDLIRRAGLAEHFAAQKNMSDAQREYDMLVRDYAKVANVQYAYGRFLLINRDDEAALAAFQREIQNWPKHTLARCQIANIKLRNKDIEGGLPFAEEAVKLAPRLPLGRFVLGRLLLEAGQNDRAIQELEIVSRMVPDEPKIYFALARAYTKAQRKQDADRARATFTRLSQSAQAEGQGSALPDDDSATDKPPRR
jgi:tetratricopeptide (TPR) repeat protein